jgi:hypothetical protein
MELYTNDFFGALRLEWVEWGLEQCRQLHGGAAGETPAGGGA